MVQGRPVLGEQVNSRKNLASNLFRQAVEPDLNRSLTALLKEFYLPALHCESYPSQEQFIIFDKSCK